jgi:flagellar L-ring protein precursor FlgH
MRLLSASLLAWLVCFASQAYGQNSRLFSQATPLKTTAVSGPTVDTANWISVPLPPPKEIRVNDIITIRVDLMARTSQEGEMQRRKTSNYNALLSSFVTLEGLSQLKRAPQTSGDQQVQGELNNQYRTTADYQTSESLKFEVAATVAAILPNGNLVLEAHRKVKNNNEMWMHSLSGVCHKDAVQNGNFVLSKDIASLEITKEELGHVRDSYERGWLQKIWDRVRLF